MLIPSAITWTLVTNSISFVCKCWTEFKFKTIQFIKIGKESWKEEMKTSVYWSVSQCSSYIWESLTSSELQPSVSSVSSVFRSRSVWNMWLKQVRSAGRLYANTRVLKSILRHTGSQGSEEGIGETCSCRCVLVRKTSSSIWYKLQARKGRSDWFQHEVHLSGWGELWKKHEWQ